MSLWAWRQHAGAVELVTLPGVEMLPPEWQMACPSMLSEAFVKP